MTTRKFSLLFAALLLCIVALSARTSAPAQTARPGGVRVATAPSPTPIPTPAPEPGDDADGPGPCMAPCWFDEATGQFYCPC